MPEIARRFHFAFIKISQIFPITEWFSKTTRTTELLKGRFLGSYLIHSGQVGVRNLHFNKHYKGFLYTALVRTP
jgi:hypothetical protein